MIIKVIPFGKEFKVQLRQGNQYFRIEYSGTKAECKWMARMFRIALKSHNKEVLMKQKGREKDAQDSKSHT